MCVYLGTHLPKGARGLCGGRVTKGGKWWGSVWLGVREKTLCAGEWCGGGGEKLEHAYTETGTGNAGVVIIKKLRSFL